MLDVLNEDPQTHSIMKHHLIFSQFRSHGRGLYKPYWVENTTTVTDTKLPTFRNEVHMKKFFTREILFLASESAVYVHNDTVLCTDLFHWNALIMEAWGLLLNTMNKLCD